MAGVVVLDADVLIGHLDSRDAHHQGARALLAGLAREGHVFAATTMTLAEVMVGPAAAGRLEDAEAALRRIGVEEIAVGGGAATRLARLRSATGRRLPDCCVLLAAEDAGTTTIATFDERLGDAAAKRGFDVVTGWA